MVILTFILWRSLLLSQTWKRAVCSGCLFFPSLLRGPKKVVATENSFLLINLEHCGYNKNSFLVWMKEGTMLWLCWKSSQWKFDLFLDQSDQPAKYQSFFAHRNGGTPSSVLGCLTRILSFNVNNKLSKIHGRQLPHAQFCNTVQIYNAWSLEEWHWCKKHEPSYKNWCAQWWVKPMNTNSEN